MTDHNPLDVALENRLMSHGIYVTECERLSTTAVPASSNTTDQGTDADSVPDGTGLALEYETISETPRVQTQEVGAVVRTLLAIADERDWSPGRLEATSLTTDGAVRGHWHVDRAWFDALGEDLDQLAFSQRVLETRRSDDDEASSTD